MRRANRKLWAGIGFAASAAFGLEGGWKLAWSDEFEGPAVDAATWGF
jgi:hypothetical protein